jgi:hypothetical protein
MTEQKDPKPITTKIPAMSRKAQTPEYIANEVVAQVRGGGVKAVLVTVCLNSGHTASIVSDCKDSDLALMGACQDNFVKRHLFRGNNG